MIDFTNILFLTVLVQLVLAGPVYTLKHPVCKDDSSWTRVEKVVNVDYTFTLSGNNHWTQFPDMAMEIQLPFSQYV